MVVTLIAATRTDMLPPKPPITRKHSHGHGHNPKAHLSLPTPLFKNKHLSLTRRCRLPNKASAATSRTKPRLPPVVARNYSTVSPVDRRCRHLSTVAYQRVSPLFLPPHRVTSAWLMALHHPPPATITVSPCSPATQTLSSNASLRSDTPARRPQSPPRPAAIRRLSAHLHLATHRRRTPTFPFLCSAVCRAGTPPHQNQPPCVVTRRVGGK